MIVQPRGTWPVSRAASVASRWSTSFTSGPLEDSTADVTTPRPSDLAVSPATRQVVFSLFLNKFHA